MQVKDLLYFSMRSLIIRFSVAQCFKIHEAWYKLLEGPAKVYEKLQNIKAIGRGGKG